MAGRLEDCKSAIKNILAREAALVASMKGERK